LGCDRVKAANHSFIGERECKTDPIGGSPPLLGLIALNTNWPLLPVIGA
jgi:hypothetical protein